MCGSVGGAAVAVANPAAGAAKTEEPKKGADAKGGKKEEKKPVKVEEPEEDLGGMMDIFG